MFIHLRQTGEVIEKIVNDCLGLPPGFLKQYNQDRSWDFMVALLLGITEHEDGNCITLVVQDEIGGLEVKKDGNWIPVVPCPGTIVVNLGDVIQVLSNKKFKSATHRVVRSRERSRHSFAFFYTVEGEKWVEPLPEFTRGIGEYSFVQGLPGIEDEEQESSTFQA
ncbi:UNVERIFIED_CONTAM: 1-aminocyclopropane-1-carboxylate oxidase10 [Sesamum latifolium]|uniref:1-aminocyclopropane-1-carboxylate oxidase10 n=1 Tax=Sesamum latifolium TaxID=2727402 RepID=A0AAW2UJK8_9LAMI